MSSTKSGSWPWDLHFSADLPKMSSHEFWSCCCAFPQEFQGVLDKSRSFSGWGIWGSLSSSAFPAKLWLQKAKQSLPSQRAESINSQQIQNSLLGEELRNISAPGYPDTTDPEIKSHHSRQGLKSQQRKVVWSGKYSTLFCCCSHFLVRTGVLRRGTAQSSCCPMAVQHCIHPTGTLENKESVVHV